MAQTLSTLNVQPPLAAQGGGGEGGDQTACMHVLTLGMSMEVIFPSTIS